MYIGITTKSDIAKYNRRFEQKLKPFASSKHDITIGHAGGSWIETVTYSAELDMWWVFSASRDETRYWNAFGIGQPDKQANIIAEINYPIDGINFRVAANWLKNEKDDIYLFHSGKIGGGRKGVGQSAFLNWYKGDVLETVNGGYYREGLLIGKLEEGSFPFQVRNFVLEVGKFKGRSIAEVDIPAFSKEFTGEKFYGLTKTVKSNGNHGLIVNSLYTELTNLKRKAYNNGVHGRIDLYLAKNNSTITHLFEVKTGISVQTVCIAVGQLMMYSHMVKPAPKLTFVCPKTSNRRLLGFLKSIGISVLMFEIKGGKPFFLNLKNLISG